MCALAAALSGCSVLAARTSDPVAVTTPDMLASASVRVMEGSSLDGRDGDGMRIARYTTAKAAPVMQASEPMAVMARISFPRQTVRSVGDAVHHTLLRTGWTLDENTLTSDARGVLTLPLPDSHRVLGPYEVRTILQVLLGRSWVWCEDPVRRTVTFTLKDGEGATCPTGASFNDSTAAATAVPFAVQDKVVTEIEGQGNE